MSPENMPRDLSPWRKAAFVLAAIACVGSLVTLWVVAVHPSVAATWSVSVVTACVVLSAFGCSGVVVEITRGLVPGYARWSDAKHFTVVSGVFAVLFPLQLFGALTALGTHSVHAL